MSSYPIGDSRNKLAEEAASVYKFHMCPKPCKAFGIKISEICKGGQEIDTSEAPTINFWTNFSAQGSFKYLTDLEISPAVPSGVYTVRFINDYVFQLLGPVSVVNSPFYRKYDAFARISVNPEGAATYTFHSYLPEWIMTFKRSGWGGNWRAGDSIEFQLARNHVGDETQTLVFDLCKKTHTSKCSGKQFQYQVCLCPKHKLNKCACNYPVEDLHWSIVGTPPSTLFTEDWVFTWTNPDTCCIDWAELRGDYHGLFYREYNGDISLTGVRNKPISPSDIFPEEDLRNYSSVYPTFRGNDGFKCDRLSWTLVTIGTEQYYTGWNHGIIRGLLPGERVAVNAEFDDESCDGVQELAATYIETVGLVGGYVQEVVPTTTPSGLVINKYIVRIKGKDVLLSSTDFTPYSVGDFVAVQKFGMVPPIGYPSTGPWLDSDGVWRDPVPYITDQNVPKVDVDSGWIMYISEDTLQAGYYAAGYIGSPGIADFFDSADLIGSYVTIIQGAAEGQERLITSMRGNDKLVVGYPFDPIPTTTSKFQITKFETYEVTDNLKIIPYNFKNGPSYSYTGP